MSLCRVFYIYFATIFLDHILPVTGDIPERLLDMLINRCPDLQELNIDGRSSSSDFSIRPLLGARWSNLRSLTLGDYIHPATDLHSALLVEFLAAHPLEHFTALRCHDSHAHSVLQQLTSYSGCFYGLLDLPDPLLLEKLRITCHSHTVPALPTLLRTAANLNSLTSLTIIRPRADYNNWRGFHGILSSCPQLSHLEICYSADLWFPVVSLFVLLPT